MIKYTETLSLEEKVRHATKHRRVHHHPAVQTELDDDSFVAEEELMEKTEKRGNSRAAEALQDPPASPMRVLLRHAKTHKFLQFGARWTTNPKRARDFRNGWWAAIHAFTMNPRHLVIQYEFGDDRYNLNIPVLGQART
jgi:hypothetical protein